LLSLESKGLRRWRAGRKY